MLHGRYIHGFALTILMACGTVLSAQSYTNTPGDTVTSSVASGHAVVMNITQQHPTQDTLYFHWRKLTVVLPTDWTASVCDNGACFDSLVDQGMMIPIIPGENGLMSLHCTPTSPGNGIIQYTLYAENSPSHIDTLTWIIRSIATGIGTVTTPSPRVYCHSGTLHLSDISDYTSADVYDLTGRLILHRQLQGSDESIKLPHSGICIFELVLQGEDGRFITKILGE